MTSIALWFHLLLIFGGVVLLECFRPWGNHQPLFPSSQIPSLEALNPKRAVVRRKLLLYHNFFRSKVQPTASNMLLMTWHAGAAKQAQNYAERCKFLKHNPVEENTVPQLGSCGQNLFVSAQKTPWFFPLKTWFIEYQNFTFGSPNYDLHLVGHYTQMVWATSHKVGCGVAHCSGGPWGQFYNYVCHYCPGGNVDGIFQYPYKPGFKCGDCPKHCISGALCTNSCSQRDVYSNCAELKILATDVCTYGTCNATCSCENRIHKNYPWK